MEKQTTHIPCVYVEALERTNNTRSTPHAILVWARLGRVYGAPSSACLGEW